MSANCWIASPLLRRTKRVPTYGALRINRALCFRKINLRSANHLTKWDSNRSSFQVTFSRHLIYAPAQYYAPRFKTFKFTYQSQSWCKNYWFRTCYSAQRVTRKTNDLMWHTKLHCSWSRQQSTIWTTNRHVEFRMHLIHTF